MFSLWPFSSSVDTSIANQNPQTKVKKGVYGTVRNIEEVKLGFKDKVADPSGPFSDLGIRNIEKIVEETSQDKRTGRLQRELLGNNRKYFQELLEWMAKGKKGEKFHSKVDRSFFMKLSDLYDCDGKTPLMHAIDFIFEDDSKIHLIEALKELGLDLSESVKVLQGETSITMSPLAYIWWQNKWNECPAERCQLIADELIAHGVLLNESFGKKGQNVALFISKTGILSPGYFIAWFLAQGGEVDFRDKEGNTLLYQELMRKVPQQRENLVVNLLLTKNPDLLTPNNEGKNAFHLLCKHSKGSASDAAVLKSMVSKSLYQNLGILDKSGHSVLYYSLTKLPLIREIADIVQKSSTSYYNNDGPFCEASNVQIKGELNLIEYLFENQKSLLISYAEKIAKNNTVNIRDIEETVEEKQMPQIETLLPLLSGNSRSLLVGKDVEHGTVLHALAKGSYRLVERLVERQYIEKEDLELVDSCGNSVAEVIDEYKNGALLVHYCENLMENEISQLLSTGIDFHGDKNCFTPIHSVFYASWNLQAKKPENEYEIWDKSFSIITQLLEHNIDPNSVTISGDTPLHAAVRSDSAMVIDLIILLIAKGAEPRIRNNNGQTPIDLIDYYPKKNNILIRKAFKEYVSRDDF